MKSNTVLAFSVNEGQTIFWHGEWWQVKKNYCHPKSCYAKMSLVNEGFAKEHGRNATMYTSKTIGLHDLVTVLTGEGEQLRKAETTQVSLCRALDLIAGLEVKIKSYADCLNLPEVVTIVQGGFPMDSAVVKRLCHEQMMAVFNQLKNTVQGIEKP